MILPKFVTSFLLERYSWIRVGELISDRRVLENDVPQGSPLGGTLFIIGTNDTFRGIEACIGNCYTLMTLL